MPATAPANRSGFQQIGRCPFGYPKSGQAPTTETMIFDKRLLFAALPLAMSCIVLAQRTPDEALQALQKGNQRFADEGSVPQPIGPGVRRTLARGQSPYAVVVTCADSRVPPEHLFNVGLGELIVVRTAGHVVGPEAIATIEHAVERLNVPLCVVLGHESCDVVAAAAEQSLSTNTENQPSDALVYLLERIEPAIRKARALDLGNSEMRGMAEEEHAHATVKECMRRSPLLRRFASVGRFRMVAARYHTEGNVEWLPSRPIPNPEQVDRPAMLESVEPGMPPHVALRMLRAGHRRFMGDTRPMPDLSKDQRAAIADSQRPLAIVVTDSDSRVSPEHIFDAGLGDLYVIRSGGNTLTDETLASIEFAAEKLGASLLVVMGHNRCEPMMAAADHPMMQQMTPHQRRLLKSLEPSVSAARANHAEDVVQQATQENAMRTLQEARSRSTLLRTLEEEGTFSMLASYYDVATGDLTWLKLPPTGGAFLAQVRDQSTEVNSEATTTESESESHAKTESETSETSESGDAHGEATATAEHAELPVFDMPAAPFGESVGTSSKNEHAISGSHAAPSVESHVVPVQPSSHAIPTAGGHYVTVPAGHGASANGYGGSQTFFVPMVDSHYGSYQGAGNNSRGDLSKQLSELFKNPVVLGGMGGIGAVLTAAWLFLRRRR